MAYLSKREFSVIAELVKARSSALGLSSCAARRYWRIWGHAAERGKMTAIAALRLKAQMGIADTPARKDLTTPLDDLLYRFAEARAEDETSQLKALEAVGSHVFYLLRTRLKHGVDMLLRGRSHLDPVCISIETPKMAGYILIMLHDGPGVPMISRNIKYNKEAVVHRDGCFELSAVTLQEAFKWVDAHMKVADKSGKLFALGVDYAELAVD